MSRNGSHLTCDLWSRQQKTCYVSFYQRKVGGCEFFSFRIFSRLWMPFCKRKLFHAFLKNQHRDQTLRYMFKEATNLPLSVLESMMNLLITWWIISMLVKAYDYGNISDRNLDIYISIPKVADQYPTTPPPHPPTHTQTIYWLYTTQITIIFLMLYFLN